MEDQKIASVYDPKVLEFVAVANEFCWVLEDPKHSGEGKGLLKHLSLLLPLLYLKVGTLPAFEESGEHILEEFVDEASYNQILFVTRERLAEHDDYLDYQPHDLEYSEDAQQSSISEKLADMYQDIKNFLVVYQIAQEVLMNDALARCQQDFQSRWGQCLTSVLQAMHFALYGPEEE